MPSALVAALSAPIRNVQSMVGPGWSSDPATDPAALLARARDALTGTGDAARSAWSGVDLHWRGAGATAATDFAASTANAVDRLAARTDRLTTTAADAASAVARSSDRLRTIVERFEARAGALEPHLDSPGVAEELLAEAQRSLAEALAVVDELRAELDTHATAVTHTTAQDAAVAPAPTAPAGFTGAPPPGPSLGAGAPMSPLPSVGALGFGSGLGSGLGELAALAPDHPDAAVSPADSGTFGAGMAVRLPDGSTAMAPNAVAASAVRHALTQLGVPYQWGGTTPGVALDCSGLTQWAYHEAGLNIPRLAQEQDVGTAVDAGSLRPGDLAVWDGHVAMIVGNGMMIEAGDPVQLSPIRTTNAGQGFQGFFRPTR